MAAAFRAVSGVIRPLLTGSAHRAKSGDLATAGPAAAGALPLQQRFNAAMACSAQDSAATMNALAQELAAQAETHALVRVWDKLKAAGCAHAATREAIEKLHSRGKGKIPPGTLAVGPPPSSGTGRELAPARRLHKICKGAVLSGRSEAAKDHFGAACTFLEALRREHHGGGPPYPGGKLDGKKKGGLALLLVKALGVKKDVARGIVTKLKQTKRGKELLFK